MVTSMHMRVFGRRPRAVRRILTSALATAAFALAIGATPALASTGTQPVSAGVRCTWHPMSAANIAAEPWTQARYDLGALGQISEGAGTTVAVIDSGVDATNPHLANAVRPGGDLLDGTGSGTDDCVGHGTAVASLIAARPVAGAGLRGLAPAATILAVRVSERTENENGTPTGAGDMPALIDGILRAVAARPTPDVINLSISTTTDHTGLHAAVQSALDADIVVVAAVGNQYERGNATPYPAAYDGVIGVGAVARSGARVSGSQVGPYVDIVAPGEEIVGAAPSHGYLVQTGTSFATPFVAATAALVRARWPHLSRTEVAHRLLATADPASGGQPSPEYGHGVLNPLRALTEVLPPPGDDTTVVPEPVIGPVPALADATYGPSIVAVRAATILIVATIVGAALAAATPLGRRRRWRPGIVDYGARTNYGTTTNAVPPYQPAPDLVSSTGTTVSGPT